MGYMTNQWLTGDSFSERKPRNHYPVEVTFSAEPADDAWSKENNVVVEIFASRHQRRGYHSLLLTQTESEEIANVLLRSCSEKFRANVAAEFVSEVKNSSELKSLGNAIEKPIKSKRKKPQ